MTTYDWIVIGAGITGASLAYELTQQNFQVLLLEKDAIPDNATVYSYGGLAYWSGTDDLTRTLGREGIELHRHISEELDAQTEFREVDLVLTIDRQVDPEAIAQNYVAFDLTPELLNVQDACILEPLLNPNAISGVLKLPHAHIHPQKTTDAYLQAFQRNKGTIVYERAIDLLHRGEDIVGVITNSGRHYAANTIVCAGGLSRSLLRQANIDVKNYFTQAQLIMTPPVDLELATVVMPAVQQRFILEAETTTANAAWNPPYNEPIQQILDPGAVQFRDGSVCMGQISTIAYDPRVKIDLTTAEAQIREQVGNILPLLEDLPGKCHTCLVAFNNRGIALVGRPTSATGLYLFSGFTSTLLYAPILARRFSLWLTGKEDRIIEHLQSIIN
jgi:glycine/D-amino acid oxidase-like deaminating enzyme